MCFTDFFPITNNHSHQHKSSQPCLSTQTYHHNREHFHKQQTDCVEADEEESDDDSLLAALTSAGPEAKEDDRVDDKSLLDAAGLPEPGTSGTQVDHLEGMTSEMFGDNEAFRLCDMHKDLAEVEALPDAHFGLLGSSGSLVEPQGCIDDLPDELLRQVLSRLPARDLYQNVSLVCHHWKSIVQDPKVKQTSKLHQVIYINTIKYCTIISMNMSR